MQRSAAFRQLKNVRNELEAVRYALGAISKTWHEHIVRVAAADLHFSISDVHGGTANCDATYILRLFANFESMLRDFWTNGLGRGTDPDIRPLMNRVARRRQMDPATLAAAHDVRDLRNHIMHRNQRIARLTFIDCSRKLGAYVSWLPQRW